MIEDDRPTLLEQLIAKTPGAQTREKAIASIQARRARLLAKSPPDSRRDEAIAAPEAVPLIEQPDGYAADFWKRQAAKDEAKKRPPRGKKPKLIVDNSEPPNPPKKR